MDYLTKCNKMMSQEIWTFQAGKHNIKKGTKVKIDMTYLKRK